MLAASPGCGATVTATAVADALQLSGRAVLMVDTADPVRSGLSRATRTEGPLVAGPHPAVGIRFSWRARAILARINTSLPVLAPSMVPPPPFWQPGDRRLDVTVVDIGCDAWRVSAHPLAGAGAWLQTGSPSPRPLLVVRPTVPGLAHAEQVLARLEPWIRLGAATPPTQMVVLGATRWPNTVAGHAGRRTAVLMRDAVFLPRDPAVAVHGITAAVTPARLRDAATRLLRTLGALSPAPPSRWKTLARRPKGRRSTAVNLE
ncbi:hypothetical protein ABZ863_11145 [Saccharomonospora sp. NPDC046836]|uniref:hypothetical protein n=1 Tax=Saccharomonospora sp. NPDC046836 TaxID=3156921 RepID=UPI0033CDCE3D